LTKHLLRVAAGIVPQGDRYLLQRRPPGTHMAGYWEFPGGKLEEGETPAAALAREMREELGVEIDGVRPLWVIRHAYDDREVELHFLAARIAAGEPRALHAEAIGWYAPAAMPGLPILPADLEIVARLTPAPPGFSWSATRHGAFTDCPRAYFFGYYLAKGRAEDPDPDRARLAARLAALTSLPMWVGSRVHDTIEGLLRDALAGRAPGTEPAVEQAIERMLARMRREFAASRDGDQLTADDPRSATRFAEHEYAHLAVGDEEWRGRVDEAKEMVRAFAAHGYLDAARALPQEARASVERLEKFKLDGVDVWVKIDFAWRDGDGLVHILDWKTGKKERGENPLQMMVYAGYARKVWQVEPERLRVREVYLRQADPERPCTITAETIAAAEAAIRASIGAMLERVADRARNLAREQDFELAATARPCRGCFFRAICPAPRDASAK
jgi:8-oxo-dGTP diphosphatase